MMFIALKGFKRFLLWLDEKIITRLSTVIESESFSMFETAIEHNIYPREKASVIWNGSACGVNLSKYQLPMKAQWREEVREMYGIPPSACVFGYCGRITRDKGMNELFKSFREVLKERNAYLMIIGAYDNPETIDQEVFDWAKKCPNVIFTGRQNQVSKYYSALDVFMSLSYREGFGLVVIEAAAMAVPGIVSDALGQRDTIVNGETGLLVKTKDTDSVINAMNFCIEHPEAVLEMGQKARHDVETKYDQDTLFKMLAEHRNELIEQNRK
jgi:glycosyltransferase involved in cell wall biosynthesis